MSTAVTELNEWATSKSGRIRIRLWQNLAGRFEVYGLDGHELTPDTRTFATEVEARRYANVVWARR